MNKRVGIIGYGAIGSAILGQWHNAELPHCMPVALLVRAGRKPMLPAGQEQLQVCTSLQEFLDLGLDIVLEAAGHAAVHAYGEAVLRSGADLFVISVGSLADEALHTQLLHAAQEGGSQLIIPVGAIAGLDGLAALKHAGLREVHYTSSKPPLAWQGTPAEAVCELSALTKPTPVFTGTAAEAARLFPRNANLAAAVAFAGLGLQRTRVTLIADPSLTENQACIEADAGTARMRVKVSGQSDPANPKTSLTAATSMLAALEKRTGVLTFS